MSFALLIFKSAVSKDEHLTANTLEGMYGVLQSQGHRISSTQKAMLNMVYNAPVHVSVVLMNQTLDYSTVQDSVAQHINEMKLERMTFLTQGTIAHADFDLEDVKPMIDLADWLGPKTGITFFVDISMSPSKAMCEQMNYNKVTPVEYINDLSATYQTKYKDDDTDKAR